MLNTCTMFSFNDLINCIVYFFISAWKIFLENEKPQNEGKKNILILLHFLKEESEDHKWFSKTYNKKKYMFKFKILFIKNRMKRMWGRTVKVVRWPWETKITSTTKKRLVVDYVFNTLKRSKLTDLFLSQCLLRIIPFYT